MQTTIFKKDMLKDKQHRPSTTACCLSVLSTAWKTLAATKADPLAILEASLTSVKYAFYQVLGYTTFRFLGYYSPNATAMTSVSCGFIGGAILTVPYLILLFPKGWQAHDDFGSFKQQANVLGKEMMFSAFAGGVGMLAFEGYWSGHGVLVGVGQGLMGPFVSFALLYGALKIVLGTIWVFMSTIALK